MFISNAVVYSVLGTWDLKFAHFLSQTNTEAFGENDDFENA